MTSDSRSEIISRLKKASEPRCKSTEIASGLSFFTPVEEPLDTYFAAQLENAKGSCIFCDDVADFNNKLVSLLEAKGIEKLFCNSDNIEKLLTDPRLKITNAPADFASMEIGITDCEALVAHTGSVVVSSAQLCGRKMFVYPPIHIVIAYKNQLVPYIDDAIHSLKRKYAPQFPSQITVITGPSRTADIEKTLIIGAHGPREFIVFLLT